MQQFKEKSVDKQIENKKKMYIFNDVNKEKVLEISNLVQPTPRYIERWLNDLFLLHALIRLRIYFDPKNYGLESN